MQYQKVMEGLGYSAKEAKVYLASLALGESHIADIAKKTKLPRSTVQLVANNLRTQGLMDFYTMKRHTYWVAQNPERLLLELKNKEELFKEVLPRLIQIRQKSWRNFRTKQRPSGDIGPIRIIADEAMQAVLIADEEERIQYVNTAWEKEFGYSLKEVKGKRPNILQSGKTPPRVYKKMWRLLKDGKIFQSDEVIDCRKNGTQFNLRTTIFPIEHQGSKLYVQILDDRKKVDTVTQLYKDFTTSFEYAYS